MSVNRRPNKSYTKEFKLEALKMMDDPDQSTSEVAMKLGLRRNQLYKWKEQMDKKGEVSSGKLGRPRKEDQSETSRLRQENKRFKEEVEILKKAAVFFAKELK